MTHHPGGPPDEIPAPRPGDPSTAELARLDVEIGVLTARAEQARQAWAAADSILRATRLRRDEVARQLRVHAIATAPAGPPAPAGSPPTATPPTAAPPPVGPPPVGPPPARVPETSTRTVQNVLFILGGLLLGTAAIVFTAVAWATFGVGGRATILAVVTALALGAPLLALRRGLTATAETFAGLGLLLVVLDGYAAWYVDLFGVRSLPATRYAGLVCAVTAVVAAGYRALTRLVGPTFAAIVAAQPVLPLVAAEWHPDAAGWSMVAAGVAALNLLVAFRSTRTTLTTGPTTAPTAAAVVATARRTTGWILHAIALSVAALAALIAEVDADTGREAAWAGLAVLMVAVVLAGGAALTRSSAFRALAGCLIVLSGAASASRFVTLAWPTRALVLTAGVVATAAILAALTARLLPAGARPGPGAGALIAAGVLGVVLLGMTLIAAGETVANALPMWHATVTTGARFDWQLLAALGLMTVALLAALAAAGLPRVTWLDAIVASAVLAVLALPGSVALDWWAPSIVDLAGAALLASAAVFARSSRAALVPGLGAAILTVHAVLASLARPENTAAILGAIAVLGVGLGALSRSGRSTVERLAHRRIVGGSATLAGLVALPPAVGAALVSAEVVPWWVGRWTTTAVGLVLCGLVAIRQWWPAFTWYGFAATVCSAVVWPTVVAVSGVEPVGTYAAIELIVLAAALLAITPALTESDTTVTDTDTDTLTDNADRGNTLAVGATIAGLAAIPGALMLAIDVLPAVLQVVALPYSWLSAVWSGVPAGIGLTPPGGLADPVQVTGTDAVALALLAVASATVAYAVRPRIRSAVGGLGVGGPTAILVGLTAAAAPWPAVPAATLLLGLVIIVVAALMRVGPLRATIATTQGVAYVGAGLAGALTVEWATIAALGSTVVAAAAVGAAGRTVSWRVWGWLAAVAAALATAAAAGLAADLRPRDVAFWILAVAAVSLAFGAWLRPRGTESVAVQAAAHAGAVVALLFTVGSTGLAAAVSTLWGVVVGLRALWPGTSRSGRAALTATAAAWELLAWWLLLAGRDVVLVEAYTLPLALVALLAGWAALRARPDLSSWVAYGPALCAAFLPSLAMVLVESGPTAGFPWRRLLLGAGALLVVVAGSVRRRQAPVVVGGVVLGIVALHEVVLAWDLLPRWAPLAVGGLLLVGLAMPYERRRRDLARLRGAVGRMT